jgi:hypothetical protein
VVDVIRSQFPQLLWLADLVASFILLSITYVTRHAFLYHCPRRRLASEGVLLSPFLSTRCPHEHDAVHSHSVSYLTMGNAMKHLLDGFVLAQSKGDAQPLIMRLFQSPLVRLNARSFLDCHVKISFPR